MESNARSENNIVRFFVALIAFSILPFVALFLLWVGGRAIQQFHAPVTAKSLNVSVAVEADSASTDVWENCDRQKDGAWRCMVTDEGGSGSYTFKVRVRPGSSCWDAVEVGVFDRGKPKRLSSCINHFEAGWWGVVTS